ncbi:hypothetical protein ACK8P5_25710 (plasmid) [Paenibacillus sp. EC2-1]|uniref:hypothetical protein n=1 Tax=Paenibacillus sp. EC2-1 TaxID=3388665 RepID=UPI003BEF2945
MAEFTPRWVYIPSDGQTEITLSLPYIMGDGSLKVYLNGEILTIDVDYEEVDDKKITFLYQLSQYDIVIVEHPVQFQSKTAKIVGVPGRSLFQKIGTEERLKKNQRYTASFYYDDKVMEFSFITKMDPFYSTERIIRGDYPDMFSTIKSETIALQIYMTSILVSEIAGDEALQEIEKAKEENSQFPFYVRQFVRYKVEYNLLMSIYFAISGKSSSEGTVLGDMEINRRWELGDVKDLLGEARKNIREWEKILRGSEAMRIAAGASRGGSADPYPLNTPRRVDSTE